MNRPESRNRKSSDRVSSIAGCFIAWGLPTGVLILSANMPNTIPVVWPLALTWLGIACFLNAKRCGRVHCYFTAPFFFLMALISLLHGIGWLPIKGDGWLLIGNITAIGGILLWCGSEKFFGRYFEKQPVNHDSHSDVA